MKDYQDFYFRAPDAATFLADVEHVCADNGIDTHERGIIETNRKGDTVAGQGVDVVPAGRWFTTEPEWNMGPSSNDPAETVSEGVTGDYALINVRTKDEDLIALAEQFTKTDPSLSPSEVPADEQIGSGTHRIDGSQIDSPARTW